MINLIPFNLKLEKHHLKEEEEQKSLFSLSFLGSKDPNQQFEIDLTVQTQ